MPSVTLKKPVTHDDEDLVAGDVIRDLSDKEVKRLVSLGFATLGESVTVDDGTDADETDLPDLSEEELSEIKAMNKNDLMAKLKEAGIEFSSAENKPLLQAKLMRAWAGPADDAAYAG